MAVDERPAVGLKHQHAVRRVKHRHTGRKLATLR